MPNNSSHHSELTVRLRTLTPLWTGGVDRTMDRVHETGIIGSLRWWYEAIVRGLGGSACDPTGDDRCPDKDGRYCDVCAVFGATGLQRAFRLEGPEWRNNEPQNKLTVKVNNNRGWYLRHGYMDKDKDKGKEKEEDKNILRIVPIRLPTGLTWDDVKQTLLLTLRLIECWGGLGSKTQVGYGVVKFEGVSDVNAIASFRKLKQRSKRRTVPKNAQWPSLEGIFFAKVRFNLNDSTSERWIRDRVSKIDPDEELNWYLNKANDAQRKAVLPLAPIVRYYLRGLMHPNRHPVSSRYPKSVRHRLMGELGERSLMRISHAYPVDDGQWEFRIWGWIPGTLSNNVSRDDILNNLRGWLGVQQLRQWHSPQNGALWSALGLTPIGVCWFEREPNEEAVDYLGALLNRCESDMQGDAEATEKAPQEGGTNEE